MSRLTEDQRRELATLVYIEGQMRDLADMMAHQYPTRREMEVQHQLETWADLLEQVRQEFEDAEKEQP